MPAEQRIIGGGLLLAGIAVVLILLYLFSWSSLSPEEAWTTLVSEIYPAYRRARETRDYLAWRRQAERAMDLLDKSGRAALLKLLEADAVAGDRTAAALRDLIRSGAFEKNAEGLFEFRGEWFASEVHRALQGLDAAVARIKLLERIRDVARRLVQAIQDARTGSGKALEAPPPKLVPKDDVPIMDPNPVYVHDAELYRIFGVKAAELREALATPEPGPGAPRSARLRWNKNVAPSDLGAEVEGIPEQAAELRRTATEIERFAADLRPGGEGAGPLARLMHKAANALGAGLTDPQQETYFANRERFEKPGAVVTVLRQEAAMLEAYLAEVRELGPALRGTFEVP